MKRTLFGVVFVIWAGAVTFGNALPLAVIAGPCALESRARPARSRHRR